jgi:hypothetical protein
MNMAMNIGVGTVLLTFATTGRRLIAIVDPKTVRQTSDSVQTGVVRGIDNTSASETFYAVEIKNKGKIDLFFVPQHSIRALLVIEKEEGGEEEGK